MTSHRRLVIYRRADGLFDFRVIAHNGEIVAASAQGFTRRDDAVEAANRKFPELPVEIEMTSRAGPHRARGKKGRRPGYRPPELSGDEIRAIAERLEAAGIQVAREQLEVPGG